MNLTKYALENKALTYFFLVLLIFGKASKVMMKSSISAGRLISRISSLLLMLFQIEKYTLKSRRLERRHRLQPGPILLPLSLMSWKT